MGNTPSLGNIILEYSGQFLCRFRCNRIPPCTEGHQKLPVFVKCHIAMHHCTEANASNRFKDHPVLLFHIFSQLAVAVLQSFPDHIQAIRPNIIFILVFPLVAAGSDRGMVFPYQHCFDSGRAKFYAKRRPAVDNHLFSIHRSLSFCRPNDIAAHICFT